VETLLSGLEKALHGGHLLAFGIVFLGGILTSLTPCVYPMIPITVGIIAGQKQCTRFQSFLLALIYVLGIAFTYSALGVIAVATGSLFGSLSSNIWMLFAVANICILLGLSMLDVFTINLPVLSNLIGKNARGGNLFGVFVLGAVFGLVASPCTAPVLGVILAFVGTSHSYVFGASLLFVYALGVGLLLIVIGTFAGILSHLPKSGKWMVAVKKIFGYVMIAMGEYFLIQMGKNMF
jgi:cytochrome c-type biogenesis protein